MSVIQGISSVPTEPPSKKTICQQLFSVHVALLSVALLDRGPSQRKSSGPGNVSADLLMSFCLFLSPGSSALCPGTCSQQAAKAQIPRLRTSRRLTPTSRWCPYRHRTASRRGVPRVGPPERESPPKNRQKHSPKAGGLYYTMSRNFYIIFLHDVAFFWFR